MHLREYIEGLVVEVKNSQYKHFGRRTCYTGILTKGTALINEKNADTLHPSITHLATSAGGAQSQGMQTATAHSCTLPEVSFSPYLSRSHIAFHSTSRV